MAINPSQHFVYLNWRPSKHAALRQLSDDKCSVSITSSVGPYKNSFADFVMEKNQVYYWQVKVITGNYFKIGVIKQESIERVGKKAFSDIATGYSFFSTGKLRNGSNTTGTEFGFGYGPGDKIKVEFNTKQGSLKFGKNNDDLKLAYNVPEFKKGGYVAAVAALIEGSQFSLTLPGLED